VFDALKGQITSAPILSSPDNSSPFRIEADSSDFATGAVLSQQSTEGAEHLFMSSFEKRLILINPGYSHFFHSFIHSLID
jgi:hypothetical protein